MTATLPTTDTYLLGRSDAETERLIRQARIVGPFTRAFLQQAGIAPGMRVLDIGSGAGDVAMLAAELVGPAGTVLGLDHNPRVLAVARERAQAARLHQLAFAALDLTREEPAGEFDAIIGRFILMHVADPADLLRRLAAHLRPGGIVAFQDYNLTRASVQWHPAMPLWERFWELAQTTFARAGVETAMGFRYPAVFRAAGLPAPRLRIDATIVHGPDAEAYEYAADTMRSILPATTRLGIASAEEVDVDTLADRLRSETLAHEGVVKIPDLVGAWTTVR